LLERVFALPDMARNGFVIGEVGKREAAVQIGRSEIDPEMARLFAVDGARAAIGAGRASLNIRRNARHFEKAGHQRFKRLRHARANIGERFFDQGHNLLTALIAR